MVRRGPTPYGDRMSTDPLDREDLRQRVQKALDGFVAGQLPALDAISEELGPLTDALSDLIAGGKRLRPAFCYWGYLGAGGEDGEQVVAAAAALELFQACALIHDDVMDGSDTRRGQRPSHGGRPVGRPTDQHVPIGHVRHESQHRRALVLVPTPVRPLPRPRGQPAAVRPSGPGQHQQLEPAPGGQFLQLLQQHGALPVVHPVEQGRLARAQGQGLQHRAERCDADPGCHQQQTTVAAAALSLTIALILAVFMFYNVMERRIAAERLAASRALTDLDFGMADLPEAERQTLYELLRRVRLGAGDVAPGAALDAG